MIVSILTPCLVLAEKNINDNTSQSSETIPDSAPIGIKFDDPNTKDSGSLIKTASIDSDTVAGNSIAKLYVSNDVLFVEVKVKESNTKIKLSVFNMLAKEVLEIYDERQGSLIETYQKSISNLPNGAYICVLVGSDFRDAEKLIISR